MVAVQKWLKTTVLQRDVSQVTIFLVRMLREELQLLQEQGSYVGEVVKPIDKKKVLVKVHPEGKFVVDIDKSIKIEDVSNWNCVFINLSASIGKTAAPEVECEMDYVACYVRSCGCNNQYLSVFALSLMIWTVSYQQLNCDIAHTRVA